MWGSGWFWLWMRWFRWLILFQVLDFDLDFYLILILFQVLHLLDAVGADFLCCLPDDDQRSQGTMAMISKMVIFLHEHDHYMSWLFRPSSSCSYPRLTFASSTTSLSFFTNFVKIRYSFHQHNHNHDFLIDILCMIIDHWK